MMRIIGYVFCYILLLLIVIPSIPLPFSIGFLSDIFGGTIGGLITIGTVLIFFCFLSFYLLYLFYELIRYRRFNKSIAIDLLILPTLFFLIIFQTNYLVGDKAEYIFNLNKDKNPDNFHNPFINYQMMDCRNFTEEYDVIFIPQHIAIETEYLAYAPRRKDKSMGYLGGKKFDENWYWEFSGSMWEDDLRKCYFQSKRSF